MYTSSFWIFFTTKCNKSDPMNLTAACSFHAIDVGFFNKLFWQHQDYPQKDETSDGSEHVLT